MFKFFRRSKNKNASTKDATTSNKTQNKQNTNSTTEFNQQQQQQQQQQQHHHHHHNHHHNQTLQKQIDNVDVKLAENACAIFNADVINKTYDNVENNTVSDSNDCGGVTIVNVLVENVTNIDVSSSENQNNLKKDIVSSRNEIVDQIQCRNKNVSEGSIPISIDQIDKKQQKDHNQQQYDEQYCGNRLERRDLNVRKIKFNPLNKSREFFNGIMAKGRNRHRNRNNNNNKDINNKQSKSQQDHPQQQVSTKEVVKLSDRLEVDPVVTVGAVGVAGGCAVRSDPPANKDLNRKENFPFGYQITKSKNSKNLVMRFAEGEDLNEKSDEDRCDDPSSSSTSTSDIDANATDSSNNTDEFCASANTVNTYENRIVKQDEDHRNDHQHNNNEDDLGAQYIHVSHIDGEVTKNYSDHIENVKNDDDHDNNDNATASSLINSPIQSILLNTNKNLCDEDDENCERQYPQNDSFSVQLKNDDVEDISELTDSDRVNLLLLKIDMGQPISKEGSSATSNLLSTNTCNLNQLNNNNNKNLIIPTITVADYSDRIDNNEKIVHHNDTTDIFYDSEENFDTETDHHKISINTAQEAFKATDLNNDLNENNNVNNTNNKNNNNNEWHFVTNNNNNNNNSDVVKIEDDPDDANDKNIIFNSNSENISTTSLSTSDNNNKAYLNSDSDNIETIDNKNLLVIDSRTINNDSGINLNFDSEESFLRGNSTDCDDNLIQSDYEIVYDHENVNNNSNSNNNSNNNNKNSSDHHIIIDSISLPDVVVESTGMGSSHSNLTVRTDSVEDNIVDNSTIIINNDDHNDNNKRDLVNQEAHFSTQIQEAQKIAFSAQTKANELQYKIEELERELSVKSWNVDRLQTELQALHKEDEGLRKRLKNIEEEKHSLRQKLSETEEELKRKHDDLQTQYNKLQEKCRDIQSLVTSLKAQLAFAQSNVDQIRSEKEKLRTEKDEELKKLQESLDKSNQDKKEQEVKWQKEFEKLRTQNADQEEHLMSDCEWKLRTMQKNCKEKLDAAEKAKKEALARAAEVEAKAMEQTDELQRLRCCEPEIKSLRGLTEEQRQSIMIMTEQVEELKEELESANQRLEDQIEAVRKIKFQCNNALCDKDRHMIQKIDEARYDVAMQWEEKLLTEMTRLTTELNTVHGDERNDAVRKLQEEHLEEIRALTTRYNANEEELREEVEKLKNEIKMKDKKYKDLQTKTDSALLETRLHLERADRDYQCAMNREDEKRERLCETMKKEFEIEKKDMEEQFRQRINQVKDEFARELANTTEEMAIAHRKQLEHQWEQLVQEKEEALQAMETRHRIRLEEAENRIKDLEIEHQRDLKELKNNFDIERTTLESRDHQNNQEIEQLHRKCRCLTNLFEEMRVRYERRDPRPEDLRDIDELRSRCESQERDLHILTERLREMQIQIADQMQVNNNNNTNAALGSKKSRVIRKPPPKTIPTNCDVIYEENEERDSPMKEHCSEVNGTNKTSELIEEVAAES